MFIGAHVILSATREVNRGNRMLYIPYLIIGAAALLLLIRFRFVADSRSQGA